MKKLLFIICFAFVIGCNNVNPKSFPINNDRFEDYVPWWYTNDIESLTNHIDLIIYNKGGEYVYFR